MVCVCVEEKLQKFEILGYSHSSLISNLCIQFRCPLLHTHWHTFIYGQDYYSIICLLMFVCVCVCMCIVRISSAVRIVANGLTKVWELVPMHNAHIYLPSVYIRAHSNWLILSRHGKCDHIPICIYASSNISPRTFDFWL